MQAVKGKIGVLLEGLLAIAQVSKTDFALYMNMTPSGLSKILTGRQLPNPREKQRFSEQSARYFSEAIYGPSCYVKLAHLFPVIYDFGSQYELELFLFRAVKYALDFDLAPECGENQDNPDAETSFFGPKTVLNMLCVLVSDSLLNEADAPREFYSTLPTLQASFPDLFSQIKLFTHREKTRIFFHKFLFLPELEAGKDAGQIEILHYIEKFQWQADLTFWTLSEQIRSFFLLLKGSFLVVFNLLPDGSPLMTVIRHKAYLTAFYTGLLKKPGLQKISYGRDETIALLEADPSRIDRMLARGMDAVYNFISIGHLVTKEELDAVPGSEIAKAAMLKIFEYVLTQDTTFLVTVDAMKNCYATGRVIVPLLGKVSIPPEQRIAYLSRFDSYRSEENPEKIVVMNCEMPKSAIFHFSGISAVYTINSKYGDEKIHFFHTDMLHNALKSRIAGGEVQIFPFSEDLWHAFLRGLSSGV